jgi:hypothetical protein
MRPAVGYRLEYLPQQYRERWLKPLSYLRQALKTIGLICEDKPDYVWFQSPPTFVAHFIVLARILGFGQFRIVADCHNKALDGDIPGNFWPKILGARWALNRCDLVLAHNSAVLEKAMAYGVERERLVVLETRPAPLAEATTETPPAGRPVVLVPCSYADDEPIDEVLAAAALLPDVDFRLTGNRDKAAAKGFVGKAPANVRFTGFLSAQDYTALLIRCNVVLGLTGSEDIQLSAANEAVGATRPMVLSDTGILRNLFGSAAIFAPNKAASLAAGLSEALGRQQELSLASLALKQAREARWQQQLHACLAKLA